MSLWVKHVCACANTVKTEDSKRMHKPRSREYFEKSISHKRILRSTPNPTADYTCLRCPPKIATPRPLCYRRFDSTCERKEASHGGLDHPWRFSSHRLHLGGDV